MCTTLSNQQNSGHGFFDSVTRPELVNARCQGPGQSRAVINRCSELLLEVASSPLCWEAFRCTTSVVSAAAIKVIVSYHPREVSNVH